ncbi:MAG: class I SAM-dependent methyltransferase [Betaproteobacteria bacterium]|nr:class I SAM-dependent methyltransferase [Betaproteobacteria bacterium]
MIRDQHYRAKLPFRARSHAQLVELVGGVFTEIDERLERNDIVRVLELGCGYGTVLLELQRRYGQRVEASGINREPGDGDADILLRNGIERGLIAADAPMISPLPVITHVDVALGLPFADGSFDIVYSQVAWLYFANKVAVLREVSRVLRDDGLAKIDADELRPGLPDEYQRLVEIWQDGRLIPFGDYLRRFGMAFAPAADGEYLRFGKSPRFGEDLQLVCEIDLSELHAHWDGIKCVYRLTPA